MYEGIKFYDDVNGRQELDKDNVIAAMQLDMQFLRTCAYILTSAKSMSRSAMAR